MNLREKLRARIPYLQRVRAVTQADIKDSATQRGLLHLLLNGIDATAGLFGARIPYIAISTRTALNVLAAQTRNPLTWHLVVPLWALVLGAFLETVDPGHLQQAMVGDAARNANALGYIAPALAPPVLP